MTHTRRLRTPNNYLWSRILERHRSRRGLLPPRVPMVLRRRLAAEGARAIVSSTQNNVSHYHFAVHVHLSSLWWPPSAARHRAPQESDTRRILLRGLAAHAAQTVRHATNANGPASVRTEHARRASTLAAVSGSTGERRPSRAPAVPRGVTPSVARSLDLAVTPSYRPSAHALPSQPAIASTMASPSQSIGEAPRLTLRGRVPAMTSAAPRRMMPSLVARVSARPHTSQGGEQPERSRQLPRAPGRAMRLPARMTARNPIQRAEGDRIRASRTAIRITVPAPVRPIATIVPRAAQRLVEMHGHGSSGPGASPAGRSRTPLYTQPAARSLSTVAASAPLAPAPVMRSTPALQVQHVQAAPPPPIDIGRLSEDVYHHIQRRMRIERERRGL